MSVGTYLSNALAAEHVLGITQPLTSQSCLRGMRSFVLKRVHARAVIESTVSARSIVGRLFYVPLLWHVRILVRKDCSEPTDWTIFLYRDTVVELFRTTALPPCSGTNSQEVVPRAPTDSSE